MLSHLSIRNILLIDTLDLVFDPALTVLTGETGAGKSIILDALHLVLGARGDGTLVRSQTSQGSVTATFDLPPRHASLLHPLLDTLGIERQETYSLILRRLQEADGRTRAFINDIPVSVNTLKTVSTHLIEIHDQGDNLALNDNTIHRSWLDSYGGITPLAQEVIQAYNALQSTQKAYDSFQKDHAERQKEYDFLDYTVKELTALAPQSGEEEALAEQRRILINGEKLSQAFSQTRTLLDGQNSVCSTLSSAIRLLERQSHMAPTLTEPCLTALYNALSTSKEALECVQNACDASTPSSHTLERIEERLFALRASARKYGTPSDDLGALCERYQSDLNAHIHYDETHAQCASDVTKARQRYHQKAQVLSEARHQWSHHLEHDIAHELPALNLPNARCFLHIDTDPSLESPGGYDRIEFWVQTHSENPPGPLRKIASGGELSRFLLAIKVVMVKKWSVPTLIFDEIDTGMGGAAANAVGVRLECLAQHTQVIAITHAPQVAARATGHYTVSKNPQDGCTQVSYLSSDERREEIARMLSGARISDQARAAASQLLEREVS